MNDFIKLGEEHTIISPGHMLSIVKWHSKFLGYLGMVHFEGIYLLEGNGIFDLELSLDSPIIKGRRTPSAIVIDDKVHLFCARKLGHSKKDIYKNQQIEYWISNDHTKFKRIKGIADGSAPFIFPYDGEYYLYFHRRTDNLHEILVRHSPYIDKLDTAPEIKLLERSHSFSVPSISYRNNVFWLTCEEKIDKEWQTVLFKSNSPIKSFSLVRTLLDTPCVYQHNINGWYFITYSRQTPKGWDIRIKKAVGI